jgi:hypothetical protein
VRNQSAKDALRDHVNMFDSVVLVKKEEATVNEGGDIKMRIQTPGGKTEEITVLNPYRKDVFDSREAARDIGGELGDSVNRDAINALGVKQLEGFADTKRQVRLLESLWLCGNNRGVGCFPELVMLELVEALKVGAEDNAKKEAAQILEGTPIGVLKTAVEKYLATMRKPEVAPAPAPAAPAGPAAPEGIQAAVVASQAAELAKAAAQAAGGGRPRSLRVRPAIGAIGEKGFLPSRTLGAIPASRK